MIFVAIIGVLALALTLFKGRHPYPLIGPVERRRSTSMYWITIVVEIFLVLVGLAGHFST
jgi:hypothetical protein